MEQEWDLNFCAGYLVPQLKGEDSASIEMKVQGSFVALNQELKDFFIPLFTEAATKYPVDIVFSIAENGAQENPVRDLIRTIAFGDQDDRVAAAKALACRLAGVTDQRSPIGLLVVLAGISREFCRIAIWKFPADESLQASFSGTGLAIQLIKDAFSRKGNYFKAALFEGTSASNSFWGGKIEDKQAKERIGESSELWVKDFLDARTDMTPSRGSKILAQALKETIHQTDSLELQEQLTAAAIAVKSQGGKQTTLHDFAEDYLPQEARETFLKCAGTPVIQEIAFHIDIPTLNKLLGLKSLVLSNSFMITGPLDEFDNVVHVFDEGGQVNINIEGRVDGNIVKSTNSRS